MDWRLVLLIVLIILTVISFISFVISIVIARKKMSSSNAAMQRKRKNMFR